MILGLSTGCIYRWGNLDHILDVYREELQVEAVELMLANKRLLDAFSISKQNADWLRSLEYVSVHAPVKFLQEAVDAAGATHLLDAIDDIYSSFHAKAVIFHVTSPPKKEWLYERSFVPLLENGPKTGGITLDDFKAIRDEQGLGICLDVSHAFTWSIEETKRYTQEFSSTIAELHLSASEGVHEHLPLGGSRMEFQSSLPAAMRLNVPMIIESDYCGWDIASIKKDVAYMKQIIEQSKC